MVGTSGSGKVTPTGFLPEDDQGAFFVVVQLPDGASVGRTTDVVAQAEDILEGGDAVADYTSVIGLNFIDNYSQPNSAFIVVTLKPFEERKDAAQAAPRSSRGSARSSARSRGGTRRAARAAADHRPRHRRRLHLRAAGPARRRPEGAGAGAARPAASRPTQDPQLGRVFSTFSATNPSIYLDIDRDKAQILGVP